MTFFLRADKGDIATIKLDIAGSNGIDSLVFKEGDFFELKSNSEQSVGFFELDLKGYTDDSVLLDFSDSDFKNPVYIEYLSLHDAKVSKRTSIFMILDNLLSD